MQRSSVDLPEPDGPMIATTAPRATRSEMPFSTSTRPNDFHRSAISIIGCVFAPWGLARADAQPAAIAVSLGSYASKLAVAGFLLAFFESSVAKMRVFRVPVFLGAGLMLALLATLLMFVTQVRG